MCQEVSASPGAKRGHRVLGAGEGRWRASPEACSPARRVLVLCCVPWGSSLSLSEPPHTEACPPALWASVHTRWARTGTAGPQVETVLNSPFKTWLFLPKPGVLLWLMEGMAPGWEQELLLSPHRPNILTPQGYCRYRHCGVMSGNLNQERAPCTEAREASFTLRTTGVWPSKGHTGECGLRGQARPGPPTAVRLNRHGRSQICL